MKLSEGYFTRGKDEEELYYIVESRIFPKMFVRQMLYHNFCAAGQRFFVSPRRILTMLQYSGILNLI